MSLTESPLPVGTQIRFAEDISVGDLLWLDDQSEPGVIMIRRLTPVLMTQTGHIYRLCAGTRPGEARFRPISGNSPSGAA
jgi:hypothetical protein